jgi:hypothetical protein
MENNEEKRPRGSPIGYPPDLEKAATELVIEQAEVLCKEWSID